MHLRRHGWTLLLLLRVIYAEPSGSDSLVLCCGNMGNEEVGKGIHLEDTKVLVISDDIMCDKSPNHFAALNSA